MTSHQPTCNTNSLLLSLGSVGMRPLCFNDVDRPTDERAGRASSLWRHPLRPKGHLVQLEPFLQISSKQNNICLLLACAVFTLSRNRALFFNTNTTRQCWYCSATCIVVSSRGLYYVRHSFVLSVMAVVTWFAILTSVVLCRSEICGFIATYERDDRPPPPTGIENQIHDD